MRGCGMWVLSVLLSGISGLLWLVSSLLMLVGAAWVQAGDDLYFYDEHGSRVALTVTGIDAQGRERVRTGSEPASKIGLPPQSVPPETRTLTDQFVARVQPGTDVGRLAERLGVELVGGVEWSRDLFVFQGSSTLQALRAANQAFEAGQVAQVYTQFEHVRSTRSVPNDPLFGNQWHLSNTGQGGGLVGYDANVRPVWNFAEGTGLGRGVTIGIVDDGLLTGHNDLQANYRGDLSRNFSTGTNNPNPPSSDLSHGTAVAGVAAGRGNNGTGISGVAPEASLAGLRLLAPGLTDLRESQALTWQFNRFDGDQFDGIHVYNNSWGPADVGARAGAGPLTREALAVGAAEGRGGLGSIHVWAGGNGGNVDNVNYDGYANSRYTIAVGAATNQGVRAGYSERGAALLLTAPSDGGTRGITTTTIGSGFTSAYTSNFGGTSSSAPVVAGVVALMLEANPNLGWRDVQHILLDTAREIDSGHSSWVTNGAGRRHSDFYGFGSVDAAAAVEAAKTWRNVGPELMASGSRNVGVLVPDGSGNLNNPIFGAPVLSSIQITDVFQVEHVEVVFNTSGGFAGDLEVTLISPMGTESLLATLHPDGARYDNWTFMSVKHWDESSEGTWTLRVRDGWATDRTTWNNWSLRVYGAVAVPEPSTWLLVAVGLAVLVGRRTLRVRE